ALHGSARQNNPADLALGHQTIAYEWVDNPSRAPLQLLRPFEGAIAHCDTASGEALLPLGCRDTPTPWDSSPAQQALISRIDDNISHTPRPLLWRFGWTRLACRLLC